MKKISKGFGFCALLLIGCLSSTVTLAETAVDQKPVAAEASQSRTEAIMTDLLAGDDTKVKDVFNSQTPKIFIQLQTNAVKINQKIKFIWIADDTHNAAPNNTKIDEVEVPVGPEMVPGKVFTAQSSLSKPTTEQGWPVGKYHVDIYLDSTLVKTVPFTIESSAAIKD